jgi:hypothetical protein
MDACWTWEEEVMGTEYSAAEQSSPAAELAQISVTGKIWSSLIVISADTQPAGFMSAAQ